jgi:uncharacterized membrane protein YhaH (DUF805 family)
MNIISLLVSVEGRIGRAAFWLGWLILLSVELAARLALGVPLAPAPSDPFSVRLASFLIDLALLYPEAVVMVKRLHDRNRSGELIGWLFVPYTVLMITNLLGMSGDPDHMGVVESLLLAGTTIVALAFMVDLGFRRGTPGDNQFGPDPLADRLRSP